MMQRERAQRDVVDFGRAPFENVGFVVGNFRVTGAQSSGDFERRGLSIYGIDLERRANFASVINDESRNIARFRGKIDNTDASSRLDPAAHETQNQPEAAQAQT